jgi:APA family basic amino acid/polyamine antiporter
MSFSGLFRRKPVQPEATGLKRVLGAFDLTLLGIGAIIGTGIFVLTGIAAATQAGPAVVVSFIVAGLACAFAALSYAELAACVGGCGSAYGYSYAAFGEIVAWIIGWDLILEYGVAVAAVANGWSGYLNNALASIGMALPEILRAGPFPDEGKTPGLVNLPAVAIILILMGLLVMGVRQSARLNAAMVFIKLLTIAVFVGVAVFHVDPGHWTPFMPYGWFDRTVDANGASVTVGVLAAASTVFFAYVGFDAVSTAVEESRNPRRDVPIGILASLGFCTLIYILVSGLLTGLVPYPDLKVSSPVAHALELIGIDWASGLVATGVIAGLTTVMLVLYYGLTRIVFAMSRDGLLPPFFGHIDGRTHTPVRTTVLCGLLMAGFAGFVPLRALAELVNIGTLVAFVIVCAGVIVLRITHPEMPRPFRAPWGFVFPVLGVLSCGALIVFLPTHTHERFVLWLLVGLALYFVYGMRRSVLARGA